MKISKFIWDRWQRDVLDFDGNITIRSGRQVGKSEVISAKSAQFAERHPGTTTLIIAASQRQSSLLFEKVRAQFERIEDGGRPMFAEIPTLTKIVLRNGSKIYSLPAGRTGYFIRGFTIDLLIADEAAYIPEEVWKAVIPMIAVSRKVRGMGFIILLSTPFGRGGYFFDSFTDRDFKQFHVSSESCRRIPKDFLRKEKGRLSKAEYAQEYLGEFTDEFNQYFKTELIKSCMTFLDWGRGVDARPGARYYLGQDLARLGGDEVANVIVEERDLRLKAVKCLTRVRVTAPETIGETVALDKEWRFNRIFTDEGGMGGPMLDFMQERLGKRRVVGINNASKGLFVEGEEKRNKILKEDLYGNCLMLMETGRLELINDLDLLRSLKSITREYSAEGKLRIAGPYSHLAEALVRACWCVKERGLDLYVY